MRVLKNLNFVFICYLKQWCNWTHSSTPKSLTWGSSRGIAYQLNLFLFQACCHWNRSTCRFIDFCCSYGGWNHHQSKGIVCLMPACRLCSLHSSHSQVWTDNSYTYIFFSLKSFCSLGTTGSDWLWWGTLSGGELFGNHCPCPFRSISSTWIGCVSSRPWPERWNAPVHRYWKKGWYCSCQW